MAFQDESGEGGGVKKQAGIGDSRTEVGVDISKGRGGQSEGRGFSRVGVQGEVCFL